MLTKIHRVTILLLSLPLSIALILVSIKGYITPDLYQQETANWQLQAKGQDLVDLFLLAPLLMISTIMSVKVGRWWLGIWAATNVYIIYTFLIFCFAMHFNLMFLPWCFILGLSFYSILFFINILYNSTSGDRFTASSLTTVTAIYLLLISLMFYFLWLSDIIPFLRTGQIPASLQESGLQTNPVHVIDLSVFLPGVFITGILLLKRRYLGLQLAPILLIFFVIMNITIAMLQLMLRNEGLASSTSVAWIMIALAIVSLLLFILIVRKYPLYAINPGYAK